MLRRPAGPVRKLVPVLAAIAVGGLLVGGATFAMSLGPARDVTTVQADASRNPVPSPEPTRATERRASRGELRAVPRTSPSPSKTKATATTTPATTTGNSCQASYYGTGQTTADGEKFDPNAYTAANKTLPFNTRVRVTNKANGKSVVVRINDRGPFVAGRCLDLTPVAFGAIASLGSGVISVTYQVVS